MILDEFMACAVRNELEQVERKGTDRPLLEPGKASRPDVLNIPHRSSEPPRRSTKAR
jgi:hypothetical protein